MSKTDLLLAALHAEIESHRAEIDQPDTRSVMVCTKFNQDTGKPRTVIFTREAERDLTKAILGVTV